MYMPESPSRPTSEHFQNQASPFKSVSFQRRESREKSNSSHFLFNSCWKNKDKLDSEKNFFGAEELPHRSVSFVNPNQANFYGLESMQHVKSHQATIRFSGSSNYPYAPSTQPMHYP